MFLMDAQGPVNLLKMGRRALRQGGGGGREGRRVGAEVGGASPKLLAETKSDEIKRKLGVRFLSRRGPKGPPNILYEPTWQCTVIADEA